MRDFVCVVLVVFGYLGILWVSTTPRKCLPYDPTDECIEGVYRLHIFEKPWHRYPSARVDAHCFYINSAGRVVAHTIRFVTFFEYPAQDEVSEVWWAEEQELPPLSNRNTLCRVL